MFCVFASTLGLTVGSIVACGDAVTSGSIDESQQMSTSNRVLYKTTATANQLGL